MISIVIPSRNDDIEVFQKTINAIKKQTVLPKEIIIVDDNSNDKSHEILKNLKKDFKVHLTTDVHETSQIDQLSDLIDVFQIPAFLCRQTDLIKVAAQTKKIVNVNNHLNHPNQ